MSAILFRPAACRHRRRLIRLTPGSEGSAAVGGEKPVALTEERRPVNHRALLHSAFQSEKARTATSHPFYLISLFDMDMVLSFQQHTVIFLVIQRHYGSTLSSSFSPIFACA
ncbi:hypothetical protein F2P81_009985 [Scophthalmus maximus]|uniref:Uncharacterized protein n=1 Tax=Scophthalmus maximus TaxID=52904 RepID=A0A6A4T1K2_SCOMX|nr:hypothetical protein F2P81_009985 [Scophthalmus maximus]